MAPDLHHLLLPRVTTDTPNANSPLMPPEQQIHFPATQSYLLSASQESNNLWKTYTMVPGEPTKADGHEKKQTEKKKFWKEYPEILKPKFLLEAGPAPVRLGCSELCPTKL